MTADDDTQKDNTMTARKTPTRKPAPTSLLDEYAQTIQAIEQAAATGRPLCVENPAGTITYYQVTVTDDPGN